MPVKPLSFKGDKKTTKKRKLREVSAGDPPQTPTQATHASTNPDDDDSWTWPSAVPDVTGPTILVLPTHPPTCLASDANGRIFASPLENMIDDDPRTAEPHDIRQVWVATRVPGTSTGSQDGEIGFKGAHGGWLSCDSVGVLGAAREARGTEEGFVLEPASAETPHTAWLLRTVASKKAEGELGRRYICAVTESSQAKVTAKHEADGDDGLDRRPTKISVALRGDGQASEDSSRIVIRMQARFLPRSAATVAHQKTKEKVSRQELEKVVGRKLQEDEVRNLKRAKRHGTYHEEVLNMRAKGSHDKFA